MVGSAVIFAVPAFIVDQQYGGGWVALITYPLFSGLPLIIVAFVGKAIKKSYPNPLSIGSYTRWRFGRFFQFRVTVNVLLNLGIALAVEFTAIGQIFAQYIGVQPWVPILVSAITTMVYTAADGLFISLITDVVQSAFIMLLLVIMAIFVAINFRVDALGPLPAHLDVNEVGLASIATLGISLTSSTMFSDRYENE